MEVERIPLKDHLFIVVGVVLGVAFVHNTPGLGGWAIQPRLRVTVGTCVAAHALWAVWVVSGWDGERRSCAIGLCRF